MAGYVAVARLGSGSVRPGRTSLGALDADPGPGPRDRAEVVPVIVDLRIQDDLHDRLIRLRDAWTQTTWYLFHDGWR